MFKKIILSLVLTFSPAIKVPPEELPENEMNMNYVTLSQIVEKLEEEDLNYECTGTQYLFKYCVSTKDDFDVYVVDWKNSKCFDYEAKDKKEMLEIYDAIELDREDSIKDIKEIFTKKIDMLIPVYVPARATLLTDEDYDVTFNDTTVSISFKENISNKEIKECEKNGTLYADDEIKYNKETYTVSEYYNPYSKESSILNSITILIRGPEETQMIYICTYIGGDVDEVKIVGDQIYQNIVNMK